MRPHRNVGEVEDVWAEIEDSMAMGDELGMAMARPLGGQTIDVRGCTPPPTAVVGGTILMVAAG